MSEHKYIPSNELPGRYNVTRSTIWKWVSENEFEMPVGVEGNATHQIPTGRWYVAEPAIKEMDRKLMIKGGAVKVIVPKSLQLRPQADEDILVVAVSMMRHYGGTITVNHDQETAMFYGIERYAALPYSRVNEMINNKMLVMWNKDHIHGEYYWPTPEIDMVVR